MSCRSRIGPERAITLSSSSSIAAGVFVGTTAPARIRERSMRLPITLFRRPVS